jgi:hypothetical protein
MAAKNEPRRAAEKKLTSLIVCDPARLKQASANQYWFLYKPFDAKLCCRCQKSRRG